MPDEGWTFVAPYLVLMMEDAVQRQYPLLQVFSDPRYAVRAGEACRTMPSDLPPWPVVYQQTRRWMTAGVFMATVRDLRFVLCVCFGRRGRPTAAVIDGRPMRSKPESNPRSGLDGYKRTKASKVHAVVDTLGHLMAFQVMHANEQERDQVERLAKDVQDASGENVNTLYADQGYTGHAWAEDARSLSNAVFEKPVSAEPHSQVLLG